MDTAQLDFAQKHLRMLSGLYGLLRPLDLIQPYRLEMGLPFENRSGNNLYQFWGDDITQELDKALAKSGSKVLVNLASNEYFRAVVPGSLDAEVVTPVFKDLKGDRYRVISFFAKRARGAMSQFLIRERVTTIAGITGFTGMGYAYDADDSTPQRPVFKRSN